MILNDIDEASMEYYESTMYAILFNNLYTQKLKFNFKQGNW